MSSHGFVIDLQAVKPRHCLFGSSIKGPITTIKRIFFRQRKPAPVRSLAVLCINRAVITTTRCMAACGKTLRRLAVEASSTFGNEIAHACPTGEGLSPTAHPAKVARIKLPTPFNPAPAQQQ
jgi:hypothetical protein